MCPHQLLVFPEDFLYIMGPGMDLVKDIAIDKLEKEKTFMRYLLPRELPDVSIEKLKSRHMFQIHLWEIKMLNLLIK